MSDPNSTNDDDYVLHTSPNPSQTHGFQTSVESILQHRSREMLLNYTGIPANELHAHITEIQKRSFAVSPYCSIGSMTWLNPMLPLHFAYPTILSRVKNGESIVDCACMIAQDLRQLVYDGAPSPNMHGFDLSSAFFEIGYDFFLDRSQFQGTFFQADTTQDFSSTDLGKLEGKMDIIWCAKFIHIFDWEDQIAMSAKLVRLLKPQPGSVFVGSQNGFPGGKAMGVSGSGVGGSESKRVFLCDVQHVRSIWEEVGKRTGMELEIEAKLVDLRTLGMHEEDGTGFKRVTGYNLQYLVTVK